jgi:plastocyanin
MLPAMLTRVLPLPQGASSQKGQQKELPPIAADVGDTLVFRWTPPQHAVVELPDEAKYYTCARLATAQRAGTSDTPFRFVVPRPGTFFFACPVDNHCEQGLKVRVVANAP